jgi:hypothetical protein
MIGYMPLYSKNFWKSHLRKFRQSDVLNYTWAVKGEKGEPPNKSDQDWYGFVGD